MEITIEGLEETVAMLDALPKAIVARAFTQALQAAGDVMETALYAKTPERDEGERNEEIPHLKDMIEAKVTIDAQLRGGWVDVGFGRLGYIAYFLEYGHRLLTHEPEKRFIKWVSEQKPGQPFMRAAMANCSDQAIETFTETLDNYVKTMSDYREVA